MVSSLSPTLPQHLSTSTCIYSLEHSPAYTERPCSCTPSRRRRGYTRCPELNCSLSRFFARGVASSVSGRPASQTAQHAATNIKRGGGQRGDRTGQKHRRCEPSCRQRQANERYFRACTSSLYAGDDLRLELSWVLQVQSLTPFPASLPIWLSW